MRPVARDLENVLPVLAIYPLKQAPGKPPGLQTVTHGAVGAGTKHLKVIIVPRQYEPAFEHLFRTGHNLGKSEKRKARRHKINLVPSLKPGTNDVYNPIIPYVINQSHTGAAALSYWLNVFKI